MTIEKLPIGAYIEDKIDSLVDNYEELTNQISNGINSAFEQSREFLLDMQPWMAILLFALAALFITGKIRISKKVLLGVYWQFHASLIISLSVAVIYPLNALLLFLDMSLSNHMGLPVWLIICIQVLLFLPFALLINYTLNNYLCHIRKFLVMAELFIFFLLTLWMSAGYAFLIFFAALFFSNLSYKVMGDAVQYLFTPEPYQLLLHKTVDIYKCGRCTIYSTLCLIWLLLIAMVFGRIANFPDWLNIALFVIAAVPAGIFLKSLMQKFLGLPQMFELILALALTVHLLNYLPAWLAILLYSILAVAITTELKIVAASCLGLLLVWNLGLWEPLVNTFVLVVIATLLSIVIGIPMGILASLSSIVHRILMPILDFMQTLPAFVYLLPAIFFFGLGATPAVFATVIFSAPPVIRLTVLGIDQVPEDLIEAADAFGSTWYQKLLKVQIPMSMPSIKAGINQTVLLALSMVVIAAMIGAPGLGSEVWRAIQRLKTGMGFEAGISIVILAMILDRLLQSVGGETKKAQTT